MSKRFAYCLRVLALLLPFCCAPPLFAQTIVTNFSGAPTSGCAPLTVNFTDLTTAPHTTWAWDFQNDGTVDAVVANPTFTYTTPGVYTVRLFVSDIPGPNTGALVITAYIRVFAPPVANAGPARTLCNGSTVSIGGAPTASAGTAPYTYAWTPTTGLSSSTVANPVVTSIVGPTQNYQVIVSDANGCRDTSQMTVTLANPPVASAGPGGTICRGFSVPIGGAPSGSGGTPPYTYTWSPATGLSSATAANPVATPTTTTVYQLTVRDANNCVSNISSATVTVNQRPTVSAGANRNFCIGTPVTIGGAPTASGGNAPYTYVWSPAAGLSSTNVPNPVATPAGTTTYQVIVTDGRGCIDSNTVTLTSATSPSASAGIDRTTCPGIPVPIGGAPTASSGTAPYTYLWSPASGLSSATVANPNAAPLATTSYSVTVTDANGCIVRDTVIVTTSPAIIVDAGTPSTVCIGNTTVIGGFPAASGGVGPFTYLWSPATGLSATNVANPVVTPLVATIYKLVVTDAAGCRDSATVAVNVGARPIANAGIDRTVCSSIGVTIGGSSPASGGTPPYSYQWFPAAGLSSATVANPTATPPTPTNYILVVTDANGCVSNPDTVSVQLFPTPNPVVSANGPTTFCQGDSVRLTTTTVFSRYLWSNGDTTRTITVKTSGIYSVQVTDANGCIATSPTTNVTVNLTSVPTVTTSGVTTFCMGDSVLLIASPGFSRYLWSNGDTNSIVTIKISGNYTVRVTDANGCQTVSTPVRVTVKPIPAKPTITVTGSRTFCQGDSATLSAPFGYSSYQWSSGEATRFIKVRTAGNYTVTVTDTGGCFNVSDTTRIVVNALPTAVLTASGPLRFCERDSVTVIAPVGFTSYLWSTGQRTRTITVKKSGSYWVNVTDTNSCVGRSDTAIVQADSFPRPKLVASGPTTICAGDSVSLQAPLGYIAYAWSTGAPTPSINIAQAGKYWVFVTDTNGCKGYSDSVTIIVRPIPAPKLVPNGPTTICSGDSVAISAPAGYTSYVWTTGDTTRVIKAGATGLYSVRVVDTYGCTGFSDTVGVVVNLRPQIAVTPSGVLTLCRGDSLPLSAPPGFPSYLWSNGLRTQTIMARATGKYYVTTTDTNGCKSRSDTVSVMVNALPIPIVTVNGPRVICQGDTTMLSAPNGYVTYLWSNGATTQSILVDSAANYSVTVSDTNGCIGTSRPVNVSVRALPPQPKITAVGDTTFCLGGSVRLLAPQGYTKYRWSNGDSTIAITVSDSGYYSVQVTDAFGCRNTSDSMKVTVNLPPTQPAIFAAGLTTFCEGDSVQLLAPVGYVGYLWSNGDTNSVITVGTNGDYTVQVTDNNGCSSISEPTTITVHPEPRPELATDRDRTLCFGDTVRIIAPDGYLAYFWSTGDITQSISVVDFGDYFVRVVDSNGCAGNSDTVTIKVNVPPPTPVVTITGATLFCQGDSTMLEAPAGYAAYAWSTGDSTSRIWVRDSGAYTVSVVDSNGCSTLSDTVQIRTNPTPKPVIAASGPTSLCEGANVQLAAPLGYLSYQWTNGDTSRAITVASAGSYSVMVTDVNGCLGASDPIEVKVNALPEPKLSYVGTSYCFDDSLAISAPEGMKAYLWSNGDTTQTINVNTEGVYSVMVTDTNGCQGLSDSVNVTMRAIPARPTLAIEGPDVFCEGDSTTLVAGGGFLDYRWSNGDSTRVITVGKAGIYTVRGLDTTGCYGTSDSVVVRVRPMPHPSLAVVGSGSSCLGDSIRIIAPTGYTSYAWSTGDSGRVLMAKATGSYWVTVVDTNGCRGNSDTANVQLKPFAEHLPVKITGETKFCAGGSVTLEAPRGYIGYIWSNGDTNRVITVDSSGAYSARVVNPNGCQGLTDTVSVTAHPAAIEPVIASSGRTTLCRGDSIQLSAPIGYATYEWSNGATTPSIMVNDSGTFSVKVVDTNGCPAESKPTVVTLHDAPFLAFDGIRTACTDSLTSYHVPASPDVDFHWLVTGVNAVVFSGQGTNNVQIRWIDSGAATVTVYATDTASGCFSTASIEVAVKAPVIPTITGEQSICASDSATLDAGTGYRAYRWSTGDTTQTIMVHNGGIYTVEVMSEGGCWGAAAYEVRGIKSAPQPTITLVNPNRVASDSVELIVMPGGFIDYVWYYNDQVVPELRTRTVSARRNGVYRVEVTDSNGCHGRAEIEVTLLHKAITGISLPGIKAVTNDTVMIPLRLDYAENVDSTRVLAYTATIRFNKTMLMPVDTTPRGVIDGDDRVIHLKGFHIGGAGNLVELRFLTMLGNAEETTLSLEEFAWEDTTIAVRMISGNYYADNICKQGGTRLYNANGRLALEQNRPNPANGVTTIEYETNELGPLRLQVVDMQGNVVAKVVDGEVSPGRYQVMVDIHDLPSGLYLIRLETGSGVLSKLMNVTN